MNFLRQNATFIVPIPYLFLAALKGWDGISNGDKTQFLACLGFLGAALLFYMGQKHVYQERQKKN
jgi:hypothetical protein